MCAESYRLSDPPSTARATSTGERNWSYAALAQELGMSSSEVHAALQRAQSARLYAEAVRAVIPPNLIEFLVHGVRYAFPAEFGPPARGMPTEPSILGFSSRWCHDAVHSAGSVELPSGRQIRVIDSVHFVATKLEAYSDRGEEDPIGSRDIEDVTALVDGRPELIEEIQGAPAEVRLSIASELSRLVSGTKLRRRGTNSPAARWRHGYAQFGVTSKSVMSQ